MATVLYLACGLIGAVYWRRFIAALSRHDAAVPDVRAAADAMLARPQRVFGTSMSITATYLKALFRRQNDDDLEGLRRTTLMFDGHRFTLTIARSRFSTASVARQSSA